MSKDASLYDPKTQRWITPPTNVTAGRDVSPYNPESAQGAITAGLVRSRGGNLDIMGNWSIANPEDRQIVDRMIAMGHEMEGRLRPLVAAGRLTTGQIVHAVSEATRDLPTERELKLLSEEWRTEPAINRSPEQAAAWLATERERRRAEAEARLAQAEQRLLAGLPASPALTEKPEWAIGEPLSAEQLGGTRLDRGYEYDVEIDGRRTTLRVGSDGQVYEVAGKAGSKPGAAEQGQRTSPDAARVAPNGREPATSLSAQEIAELQRIGMTPAEIDQIRQLRVIESELNTARRNPTEFVY